MSELKIIKDKLVINDFNQIKLFLNSKGVLFERWSTEVLLNDQDSSERILSAYDQYLKPFMEKHNFKSADVINIHPHTENIESIRLKFLKEHTHSEDEVRFFVDGEGLFWFHFEDGQVVSLKCTKGDFLSVPKGYKHWFDLAPNYFVKAIRIFSNKEGWVANYTNSEIDSVYNQISGIK